jgi:hypothetical protein
MKKNQLTLMAVTFISGAILGIAALGLYSFTTTGPDPAFQVQSLTKISAKDAQTLMKNYLGGAVATSGVVRGFALNKDQLAAMNQLAKENTTLTGFRVYLGYDDNSNSVGIIVGISSSGQDVTSSIYKTAFKGSGPCPTICDGASSLIAN